MEGQGVEMLVFSPERWQTWLQKRCLDNTRLYTTMENATGEAVLDRQNRVGPYVTARQSLIRYDAHQPKSSKDLSPQ